ncbi:hypothetical protein [Streptomyces pacificus]|uniref:hypothetical protein n=1 Tax=Streptomyces pacificus TaxID=2705029 RepID=UPI003531021E
MGRCGGTASGSGTLRCPGPVQMAGFRTLPPGQPVDLQWEAPGLSQDGYDYRAVSIVPRPG